MKPVMRGRRFIGILVYLLFLFAFVELSLQAFYYVTAGDFLFRRVALPLYQVEKYAGFMNRPNLSFDHHTNEFHARYYINSAGFRVARPGIEYPVKKPTNTYRIMLLGPSFAYGWGVDYEKSFAALLPRFVSERGFPKGRKIELIDAGVPAMYAAPQRIWYEHVGKHYQPDLVIQFVYGSMTVSSSVAPRFAVDPSGHLIEKALSSGQIWRERVKQLATVFYGWMIWTELDNRLSTRTAPPSKSVMGAGRELHQASSFDPAKPDERDAIKFYELLAKTVRDSGAQLKIVYFPLSYGVHPEDESRWRHLGLKNVQAQKVHDAAFMNYLNSTNIPGIDISDHLRATARNGKRLYYWLDIHWTPEGNTAAARAVAAALAAP